MRKQTIIRAALLAGPLLALCACADTEPKTDWQFGESVNSTMKSQIANPQAGGDRPVTGMDGPVAAKAAKRHESLGEEKQDDNVLKVNFKPVPNQGGSAAK